MYIYLSPSLYILSIVYTYYIQAQETNDLKNLADISVKLLEHYGFDLILLTLGVDGVLLTRKGAAAEPLPFKVGVYTPVKINIYSLTLFCNFSLKDVSSCNLCIEEEYNKDD